MNTTLRKPAMAVLACCLALTTAVLVTRGQLFSISQHLISQAMSPELASPAIASTNRAASGAAFTHRSGETEGPVTLLAVGDMANCFATTAFGRFADDLLYSAGFGSDMQARNAGHLQTEQLVRQFGDIPLLALGDLVYNSGSPAEFRHCYHPSWGRHKARTLPAPGNHEYKSFGALGYFNYWGDRAGPDRRGYYKVRFGNWLVLSLNSEVGVEHGSTQFDWIARTLDTARTDCVLAFYHSPAFSSRRRKNSDTVKPLFSLLESFGVTAVLNGHNHFYERTKPLTGAGAVAGDDGMLTFIVGTGGRAAKRRQDPSAISDKVITGQNGVLKLVLRKGALDWQFIAVAGNQVLDEGRAACRDRSRSGT